MNTKTMEGLVGARTNMNVLNTPFRIYKEARRKGDTATMDRAMGYVSDFSGKADEYKAEADKGMKEDAEAAREKAESEREKAIQKRREEREKPEERIDENRSTDTKTDTKETNACLLEISEEGKVLSRNYIDLDSKGSDETMPVIYTKTGEASLTEQGAGISISV